LNGDIIDTGGEDPVVYICYWYGETDQNNFCGALWVIWPVGEDPIYFKITCDNKFIFGSSDGGSITYDFTPPSPPLPPPPAPIPPSTVPPEEFTITFNPPPSYTPPEGRKCTIAYCYARCAALQSYSIATKLALDTFIGLRFPSVPSPSPYPELGLDIAACADILLRSDRVEEGWLEPCISAVIGVGEIVLTIAAAGNPVPALIVDAGLGVERCWDRCSNDPDYEIPEDINATRPAACRSSGDSLLFFRKTTGSVGTGGSVGIYDISKYNCTGGHYVSTEHWDESDCNWHLDSIVCCEFCQSCHNNIQDPEKKCQTVTYITNASKYVSIIQKGIDPNAKYGPEGIVAPGEKLDYKVEYENIGEGMAFGVYLTDTLDVNLDASTLQIGPVIDPATGQSIASPGIYNPRTRTIKWYVGEVASMQGGYAEFSANVKADAADGTQIINFSTAYFPSGPETTRTNGIVSTVMRDQPRIKVEPTTGLITTENGAGAMCTVVLQTKPMADVTIDLGSDDPFEGMVSPTSLTFSPGNWSQLQAVIVTGISDGILDGDVTYHIITAPAVSIDPRYSGLDSEDVTVVNIDETPADSIPPTTQIELTPSANENGWNNSDVTIDLTAADNEGGSGIKEIHYKLSGATQDEQTVSADTVNLTISNEGITTLTCYSVDNAGNQEAEQSLTLKLDKSAPEIDIVSPEAREYLASENITLDFAATDALSGISSIQATLNGLSVTDGQVINLSDMDGSYAMSVQANDNADNSASTQVTFTVSSAKAPKNGAVVKLNNARTGNRKIDETIDQAIRRINNSLDEGLWLDPCHLVYGPKNDWLHGQFDQFGKRGKTVEDKDIDDENRIGMQSPPGAKNGIMVFHQEMSAVMLLQTTVEVYEKAIPRLEKEIKKKQSRGQDVSREQAELDAMKKALPVFQEVIADLVKADMILAKVAIDDAKNKPVANPMMNKVVSREIEMADKEFARAVKAANKGQAAAAITRFSHAWFHAQLAIKFAAFEPKRP
jgi:hypothetical protein